MHVVHVDGLEPGKAYAYDVRIGAARRRLGKGHFVTAPTADSSAPAHVPRLRRRPQRRDGARGARPRADGDAVGLPRQHGRHRGRRRERGRLAGVLPRRAAAAPRPRALPRIGNHELYDDQAGVELRALLRLPGRDAATPQPYGTMRWGDVRLFFLNGMHDWQRARSANGSSASSRAPTPSRGSSGGSSSCTTAPGRAGPHGGNAKLLDAHVPELLAAHGVDLVLVGPRPHLRARARAR